MTDIQEEKPNKKACKIIGCGEVSIHNLYPLAASFFFVIRNWCNYYLLKSTQGDKDCGWSEHPFIFTFIMFLSELFIGVFNIISFFLQRSARNTLLNPVIPLPSKAKVRFTQVEIKWYKKHEFICFLLLFASTVLDGLQYASLGLMTVIDNTKYLALQCRIFNLIFIVLLCSVILLYPIYKHQIFSLILLAIGITLCTIPQIQASYTLTMLIYCLSYIVIYFINGLKEVLEKSLIEDKRMMPIKIIYIEGLLGTCITFVLLSILSLYYNDMKDSKFKEDIFLAFNHMMESWQIALVFLLYFFCSVFYNFFSINTKAFFSPTLLGVTDSFSIIAWTAIYMILEGSGKLWVMMIIGNVLLFIACLIYNEVFILYCCGFDYYTKKEINKRSVEENETIGMDMALHNDMIEQDLDRGLISQRESRNDSVRLSI